STIQNKINTLTNQLEHLEKREKEYKDELNEFGKNLEHHVILPKLSQVFKNEISLVLKETTESDQVANEKLSEPFLQELLSKAINYLTERGYELKDVSVSELAEEVLKSLKKNNTPHKYDFFQVAEIKALEKLVNDTYYNPFQGLMNKKAELDIATKDAVKMEDEIDNLKSQISAKDYSFVQQYENNEASIKN